MSAKRVLLALILALAGGPAAALEADYDRLAGTLLDAWRARQPFPLVSAAAPGIDLQTAYRVQKVYVQQRLLDDRIAGFKAGLTAAAAQRRFGVSVPVAGVLFASGRLLRDSVVERSGYAQLLVETEIGFVVSRPIRTPLGSVAELKEHIQSVLPAIELAEGAFADMQALTGPDIAAADVGAARFIAGTPLLLDDRDLNAVTVTLYRDGEVVYEGRGGDVLGDQWRAALWLVNTVLELGWIVDTGHILITGAMGRIVPGQPGRYRADFGALGEIRFEVR